MRAQQNLDYGYDTEGVMTARMGLMEGEYPTADARRIFYEKLQRQLRASPEFVEVALTNRMRMTFVPSGPARTEIEGQAYPNDTDRPNVVVENVSGAYFATLGLRMLEGREFAEDDLDTKQPVAIVSSGFARKFFGHESPVGRRLRTVANNGKLFGPWRTIVGVAPNLRMTGPFNIPNVEEFGYYLPIFAPVFGPVQDAPSAPQFTTVAVRPRGQTPAGTLIAALQREVKLVNPNQPLYFVGTPKVNQAAFTAQNQIIVIMVGVFGFVAIVLASVGLYGVMSFSVNQRAQEFGVRMALGADATRILRMVLGQGFRQIGLGLGVGLGLTFLLAYSGRSQLQTFFFQISPTDPSAYVIVGLLVAVVSLIAAVVPARRATRVDPMIALRAE
jgi:predicted permease